MACLCCPKPPAQHEDSGKDTNIPTRTKRPFNAEIQIQNSNYTTNRCHFNWFMGLLIWATSANRGTKIHWQCALCLNGFKSTLRWKQRPLPLSSLSPSTISIFGSWYLDLQKLYKPPVPLNHTCIKFSATPHYSSLLAPGFLILWA